MAMDIEHLITQGNAYRESNQPQEALRCYSQAFAEDFNNTSAWNNYGNVIREMGYPERAVPFLQQCLAIDPNHRTAQFNLSVAYLLMGDYERGWPAYESRWRFEHLDGTLPQFKQPRWTGQDLTNKRIMVIGEQGLGDTVQFARYVSALKGQGAHVILSVPAQMTQLFGPGHTIDHTVAFGEPLPEFDYWAPMMSLPGVLQERLPNILAPLHYISSDSTRSAAWREKFGRKLRLRVGIAWSGRRDTWINRHKSVPFEHVESLIARNPQYQWVNLQIDATDDESKRLSALGVDLFPGAISSMSDTAALIDQMDVVIGVDSLISHLAGAMARPAWIMLNQYAVDWRWLLNRNDSPWYPTARLFRQPTMGDWSTVMDRLHQHLELFKI